MNKLINFSIKHPVSIIMYTLLITMAGLLSLISIPLDYLPKLKDHTLLVSVFYNGLSAEQIKTTITIPVENALSSLQGLKNMSSTIRDNCSFTKLELHNDININTALIDSVQILEQLDSSLPEDCLKPEVDIYEHEKNSLLTISIVPKNATLEAVYQIAKKEIKHTLQTIPGIGSIQINGGRDQEIHILYDPMQLASKNILPQSIAESIIKTNYEYPAGTISDEENEYLVKTSGTFKSTNDINNSSINLNGTVYKIEDLGNVTSSNSELTDFAFINNQECIQLCINKKSNANPIEVSDNIKKQIETFKENYPDMTFYISEDSSENIKTSIYSVLFSALLSSIITFIIIFIYFRKIKISLLLSLPIPLCILFSVLCLKLFSQTLNHFSLSGISISIGMIVDSSIVAIENIFSFERKKFTNLFLHKKLEEVKTSIINSALTTTIVFIPFLLFKGNIGELFTPLSISVISSILFSSLLALTIIPASLKLSEQQSRYDQISFKRISSHKKNGDINTKNRNILNSSCSHYLKYLNSLKYKKNQIKTLVLTIFICTLCPVLFKVLPKEFIPEEKSDFLDITINFPSYYSLPKIKNETHNLITYLQDEIPDTQIYANGGISISNYYDLYNFLITPNTVFLKVYFKNYSDIKKILNLMNDSTLDYTILKSSDIFSKALNINSSYIYFSESEETSSNNLLQLPNSYPSLFSSELIFNPDISSCMHYNIPQYEISDYIYDFYNGIDCGTLKNGDIHKKILLKPDKKNIPEITEIFIPKDSTIIPIKSLGSFSKSRQNKILYRHNRKDALVFFEKPENINTISLFKEKTGELILSSLIMIILVTLLLYFILGAQMQSFSIPIVLIISVLPGFTGALLSLFITGNSINLDSLLALIILSGIAVNNSILIFEAYNNSKPSSFRELTFLISTKLKPIFLTTATSLLSLIPFLMVPGISTSQKSMSIALSGGLLFSFFSSLMITPLYLFKKIRRQNETN